VQEQATGQLTLSAGFSSLESFIFQGSIQQRNFRGRGQTVGLSANYSRYSRAGSVSFTEPYLFDKNISAGIDIYRRDYNNGYYDRATATYEQATTGFNLRAGVPLTENMSLLWRYTFKHDDVTIDESQYYNDFDGDGIIECEPLLAGRYLCDAVGKRTTSLIGTSLIFDTLDNRVRPTRGETATLSLDFAGIGGDTKYVRAVAQAAKFWPIGRGFILSVTGQSGFIYGLEDAEPGSDAVQLTDRFFMGEQDVRGFDIRGLGPRVVRRYYDSSDPNNPVLFPIDDDSTQDDSLGGTAMYVVRTEVEIPMSSGIREMGIRPSVFLDVGSVFGITDPILTTSPYPNGIFIPSRDASGNALFTQIDEANVVNTVCTPTATSIVTNPVNPNPPACLPSANNAAIGSSLPPFVEEFYGDTWKPRVAVGLGVNWNSPFGPFRINIAYALVSYEGDDPKTFSFNVGTQF
jgi:outer membrane protein insertion porin family